MKNLLLLTSCIVGSIISINAQEAVPADTLIDVVNPQHVVITESPTGMNINISGKEGNPDFKYTYKTEYSPNTVVTSQQENSDWNFAFPFTGKNQNKHRAKCEVFTGGLGFGFNDAVDAPADMNVAMGSSIEVFWSHIIGLRYIPWKQGPQFSLGFGIDWRNYRMTGVNRFNVVDNNVVIEKYPEGAEIDNSRIKIFSLGVPVMIKQNLGAGFSISAGAVINFNTYGSVKTKYTLDGTKCEDFSKNIHKNPVTCDIMAVLSCKAIGAYFKYSPTSVLNTDYAPKFKSLSAGIVLFY